MRSTRVIFLDETSILFVCNGSQHSAVVTPTDQFFPFVSFPLSLLIVPCNVFKAIFYLSLIIKKMLESLPRDVTGTHTSKMPLPMSLPCLVPDLLPVPVPGYRYSTGSNSEFSKIASNSDAAPLFRPPWAL